MRDIDRLGRWMNGHGAMIRQDFDALERGAMGELPVIRRLAAEIKRQAADAVVRVLVGQQNRYLCGRILLARPERRADACVAAADDEKADHGTTLRGRDIPGR